MISHKENNIKLGLFVLFALVLTIIGLYLIGKYQSLFGANFELKARFSNLKGLTPGNNVQYSGLQAGTVNRIEVINDTTFEVSMSIDDDLKSIIHKNALASISTEGLMGNKIIQINPGKGRSPVVVRGDMLKPKPTIEMDDMLITLSRTNENISQISELLKVSVLRIHQSELWKILDDEKTAIKLKLTVENMSQVSIHAKNVSENIDWMIGQTRQGKGTAGMILTDTAIASEWSTTVASLRSASKRADELTMQLTQLVDTLHSDIHNESGLLYTLLKDTAMSRKLNSTLYNLEKGTDGFNQSMEALKHNFLLRGYFKKQEKKERKFQKAD